MGRPVILLNNSFVLFMMVCDKNERVLSGMLLGRHFVIKFSNQILLSFLVLFSIMSDT